MDRRRLTFIVVPHGDLETRTYEISYRRLRVLLGVALVLTLGLVVVVSSWWYVASQAARVPGLEREVVRLEAERARVAELASTLDEVEEQYEQVRRMLGADAAPEGGEPWLPPLRDPSGTDEPQSTVGYEPDEWPLTEPGFITRAIGAEGPATHPGLDVAIPSGSYIRASARGRVAEAGQDEVYGLFVRLKHGNGYETMYGHASQLFVETGDSVAQNEVIALTGSTGRSTAPHLHFEIRKDGQAVDPLTMVSQP